MYDFVESVWFYFEVIGIFIINFCLIVNVDWSMVIRVWYVYFVDIVIYLKIFGEYDSLIYDGCNDDWWVKLVGEMIVFVIGRVECV